MSVTTIRLQPEVESGLEAMSDKLHRSKNWLINQAIREFLAKLFTPGWSRGVRPMNCLPRRRISEARLFPRGRR
jgi:Ribbon-helix-helix protein, copG family